MNEESVKLLRHRLSALGTPYKLIPCDPDRADTRVFVQHYDYSIEDCANTIVVKSKTGEQKFAACVVLATCRLDVNHTIRNKLKTRKVSFASAQETENLTGMTVGGVTPIGLPDNLPLWVDNAVMNRDEIVLGGYSRAWKIIISPEVFLQIPNTEIVEGLANPIQMK